MTVAELMIRLMTFDQHDRVVIKVLEDMPDGYCGHDVIDVAGYSPANGEVGLYWENPKRVKRD